MVIPEELLLEIFSRLPLVGIIHARSVCKHWRQTVLLADIHPPRVKLYEFYLMCISSDIFQESRKSFLPRLIPFNRKAYIENLERQYPYIPDEFVCWILEWPAKAITSHYWPGLPCKVDENSEDSGPNALGCSSPTVETIASYELENGTMGYIRGLKVVNVVGMREAWIVFDAPREDILGTVVEIGMYILEVDDGNIRGRNASSWTEWQQRELEDLDAWARSPMRHIVDVMRRHDQHQVTT
ncbi:hypothetical protein BDQ17DRAFT_1355207 [Cyathus striatus]|nr:hypothetical protein BDQ17DRAFT_1355207 [Cyathus striatus]